MKLYQSNAIEYESKTLYLYDKGTENATISGWSDNGGTNFSKLTNSIYLRLNDSSSSSSSSAAIGFSGINSSGYSHLGIDLEDVYCNTTNMSMFVTYNSWIPTESFDHWEQTYDGTTRKTIDINLTDKNISLNSFYLGWCCGNAEYFMRQNWGQSNGLTGEGYFNLKSVYLY